MESYELVTDLDLEEIGEDEDEEGSSDSSTQLTAQSCAMSHTMVSINTTTINDRMLWNPSAASKASLTSISTEKKGKGKKNHRIVGPSFRTSCPIWHRRRNLINQYSKILSLNLEHLTRLILVTVSNLLIR